MTTKIGKSLAGKSVEELNQIVFADFGSSEDAAKLLHHTDGSQVANLAKRKKIVAKKFGHDYLIYLPYLEVYQQTKSTRGWKPGRSRTAVRKK